MPEILRQAQGTFVTNESPKRSIAQLKEHQDASVIARFPPHFFQKIIKHSSQHPDEEIKMQFTDTRLILRRMKKPINLARPKSKTNGQIVSWCFLEVDSTRGA